VCSSRILARELWRAHGVLGFSLLLATAELSQAGGDSTMTLDVLYEHARVRQWYCAIGFEVVGERDWWERELSAVSGPAASVSRLPQTDICHRAFGFSEVTLHADGRSYRVRLTRHRLVPHRRRRSGESKVIVALSALDPRRRILAMAGMHDSVASRLGTLAFHSLRLRAPLTKLRQRLDRVGAEDGRDGVGEHGFRRAETGLRGHCPPTPGAELRKQSRGHRRVGSRDRCDVGSERALASLRRLVVTRGLWSSGLVWWPRASRA
jgi:hypothetical protein